MSNCGFRGRVLARLRVFFAGALVLGAFPAIAADLPPLPPGLTAPSKATRIPAFNLPMAAGGTLHAEDLRGKVVIARIWATW